MLWALLNVVQCVLIRSKVFGALVVGRIIAGEVLSCCLQLAATMHLLCCTRVEIVFVFPFYLT